MARFNVHIQSISFQEGDALEDPLVIETLNGIVIELASDGVLQYWQPGDYDDPAKSKVINLAL